MIVLLRQSPQKIPTYIIYCRRLHLFQLSIMYKSCKRLSDWYNTRYVYNANNMIIAQVYYIPGFKYVSYTLKKRVNQTIELVQLL